MGDSPPRPPARWRRVAGPAIAGIFGLGWFVRWAGWRVLDPTHVDWLLAGDDWSTHLLGWLFFRNEGLSLPVGRLDGFLYPVGTTLGFTDANPWVSTLLRPLSPLLPEAFQFIGPWLALCCILMGVLGARFAARLTPSPVLQSLGGALLATSPLLVTRSGHDALVAQWLLVALIALNVAPARGAKEARRAVGWSLAYVVIAAGVHPYLAAMAVPLAVAMVWRLVLVDKAAPSAAGVGATVVIVVAALGTFTLFGYLGGRTSTGSAGFGWFSSDLLELVNPRGQSRFLPDLPAARPNYEGWGFLGAGVLFAIAASMVSLVVRAQAVRTLPWRRTVPLLIVTLGSFLYAMGNEIHWGARPLVSLEALYVPLQPLTQTFRGNGRFIWVPHYVLAMGTVALVILLWRSRPAVATGVLGAALLIQVVDFDWKGAGVFARPRPDDGLRSAQWDELGRSYRHLALVPPLVLYSGAPCEGELPGRAWVTFGYLAYQQKMTVNSGYAARYDLDAIHRSCADVVTAVRRGDLSPDTVYVVGPKTFANARSRTGVACGVIDGYGVCVSDTVDTPLLRALRDG